MLYELLIVLLLSAVLLVVLYMVRELLVVPVETGPTARLTVLVHASGDGQQLEQTVSGLLWLRSSGKMQFDIVLRDEGLTEEGRRLAALLQRKDAAITIEEAGETITRGRQTWTNGSTYK